MKAVVLHEFGGPENLRLEERARPGPAEREVQVRMGAAGVCHHDLLTRRGAFPNIALPVVLGHQIAGTIEEIGPGVERLTMGQRVVSTGFETCGRCRQCSEGTYTLCAHGARFIGEDRDGGYAEYITAPESSWLPLPPGVDDMHGTVIMCTYGTAYHALMTRGGLVLGETVVITGASGGVGIHAVELARAAGARVIAITSSPAKSSLLTEAGADEVIASESLSFARAVKETTDGGADLVVDIVGATTLVESMHAVRRGGRVVVLGNLSGSPVTIRPAHLILKEINLIGTKAATTRELELLVQMVAERRLQPRISDTVPLSTASDAHRALERRDPTMGRIVLIPGR